MGGGLTEEDVRQAVKELAVVGVIRQIGKRNVSREWDAAHPREP